MQIKTWERGGEFGAYVRGGNGETLADACGESSEEAMDKLKRKVAHERNKWNEAWRLFED